MSTSVNVICEHTPLYYHTQNPIEEYEYERTRSINRTSLTPLEANGPHDVAPAFSSTTLLGSGSFKEVIKASLFSLKYILRLLTTPTHPSSCGLANCDRRFALHHHRNVADPVAERVRAVTLDM